MSGITSQESSHGRKKVNRSVSNGSRSRNRNYITSRRSGIFIFVTTVLVLVFTWKFQFVNNRQGWRFGNSLSRIDRLDGVSNQTVTEVVTIEKQTVTTTVGKEELETQPQTKGNNNNNNNYYIDEEDAQNRMASIKRRQIENYRNHTALMVNIHPTHHAGTNFCKRIGKHGINGSIAPGSACMNDNEGVVPDPPDWCNPSKDPFCYSFQSMKQKYPWTAMETDPFVKAIRPYFHMVSWEFGQPPKKALEGTDWENPNLVSVVITRDPLTRLLAGDADTSKSYPGFDTQELNRKGWWNYAAYDGAKGTNNFFLRILSGSFKPKFGNEQQQRLNHVEEGVNRTTEEVMDFFPTMIGQKEFERAKSLLDRFTFVLDLDCLDESYAVLRDALAIEPERRNLHKKKEKQILKQKRKKKLTPRERIGYDDVYEYLVKKNEWDTALYEYSKTISLIRCPEHAVEDNEDEEEGKLN